LPRPAINDAIKADVTTITVKGPLSAHRRSIALTHLWKALRQIMAAYENMLTLNVKTQGNIAIKVTSFNAGLLKIHEAISPLNNTKIKAENECGKKKYTNGKKYHITGVSSTVRNNRKTLDTLITKKKFVTSRARVEKGLAAAMISRRINLLSTREQKQRRAFKKTRIAKNNME
jgi:hypothetical protein